MSFVIHHVGARFGNTPVPIPEAFSQDIEVVLFDADGDCVEGLRNAGSRTVRHRLVAACLANIDGQAEFRLTLNPSASSLLEPSEAPRGFVQPLFGLDWDVEACANVVERVPLRTRRLDTLLRERPDIPAPHFLSLDTQGSEAAIIEGAAESILSGVVGMIVEVQFIDLYVGVPRFGDVAARLEAMGFHFAGFRHMIDAEASHQPLGRRSGGFPIAADALFLRRVDSVSREGGAASLLRLAFAAVIFGHLDHAFAALDAAETALPEPATFAWQRFVSRLHAAGRAAPVITAPRFPDILPPHEVKRFAIEPDFRQWPAMMDLTAWRAEHAAQGVSIDAAIAVLESTVDTPIESELRSIGFTDLADRTNFCRRDQAHKLRRFLDNRV